MNNENPSALVVGQRIRNRLIECLRLIVTANAEDPSCDLNELINQWGDWVEEECHDSAFPLPPYTAKEAASLQAVNDFITRFCEVTPQLIVDAKNEMQGPEWFDLKYAAKVALQEMELRGLLPEDVEA